MPTHTNIQLPFATSHAFLIGINDYAEVSSLSTAVNDAEVLAKVLAEDHGYRVHPPLLNATKAQIMQLLQEDLPRLVGKEDRVFFYFAGHGIALDSDDDPRGYLVPADAEAGERETLVPMDVFHQSITELPCRHGLLVLDCCFAGAFKWSTGFRDVLIDLPSIIYEERFYQYTRDPAWQVITSSASDQKAVDVLSDRTLGMRNEAGAEHSPFARALIDGIAGEADTIPKERGDGVITGTELYTYLRNRVEDETTVQGKRQSPSMFSLRKHDKGQYIFLHPNHRFNLPPIPRRNPYMGLNSYNESDAYLFYGRDRVVAALEKLVQEQQVVVVSGASGTGKSSVIKAGLLSKLRAQGRRILPIIRPGKEPLENLQREIPDLATELAEHGPVVLIIDQYEELITQCLDPDDRVAFELQLANWIEVHPQLHVVISVRSDFEPHFEYEGLRRWWSDGRYQVPVFSQDEIREVIVKPTVQEVLFFEPENLVDTLVDAVNQAPGALPLLSFTLSELYHAYINSGRTDRSLTAEDYQKLGGVIGALRNRANTIYDTMDSDHQDTMRKLMLRMVSLEGGETAGRRVLAEELVFTDPEETQRTQNVADQLVEARLITTGQDKEGNTFYEPAHDALTRAWPRLWEWIRRIGERKLGLLHKLHLAVIDYREKQEKEYLWHDDPRLQLLTPVLDVDRTVFNAVETDFLERSLRLKQHNKRRRLLLTISTAVTLLSISLISVLYSFETKSALIQVERSLAHVQSLQAKEAEAKHEAKQSKLLVDTMNQTILASKAKTNNIILKSVTALQLYAEQVKNPRRFSQTAELQDLSTEINLYARQLETLIPVFYQGIGWGYKDASGSIVIYPKYEKATPFGADELATITLHGYEYLIDKKGKIQRVANPLWQWQPIRAGDAFAETAIQSGYEKTDKLEVPLYFGQNSYRYDAGQNVTAGKVRGDSLLFPWEGTAVSTKTFHLLTLPNGHRSLWIDPALKSAYLDYEWREVVAGWESSEDGGALLLCRTRYQDHLIPGILKTKACHFIADGKEKVSNRYQLFLVATASANRPSAEHLAAAKAQADDTVYGELTGTNVNLRTAPNIDDSEVILLLSTGDRVKILKESLPEQETVPWYLIEYNDRQGWMRSDFIQKLDK